MNSIYLDDIANLKVMLARAQRNAGKSIAELKEKLAAMTSSYERADADLNRQSKLRFDAEEKVKALENEIVVLRMALGEACRELPCGAHPRLMSLGEPARFMGGCGKPVIAPEAIVCADCMAWFCSRECAYRHFHAGHNSVAINAVMRAEQAKESTNAR